MGIFTSKIRGSIGEWAVHAKLNPLIFGRVSHRCIRGLILTDETGITHQIDEVEIRKNGIFCIEVKNYTGWVFGNEDAKEWTVTYWNGEKHKVYSPLKQNSSHVYQMSQVLGNKYRVTSLVVMANNNARKIKSRYVVNLSNLKSWLKRYNDGTHLSEKEMDKIYRTLCSAHTAVSNRKHVKNIQKTQARIKKGICPRLDAAESSFFVKANTVIFMVARIIRNANSRWTQRRRSTKENNQEIRLEKEHGLCVL